MSRRSLREYVEHYDYGSQTETEINGKKYKILPIAHPRQIGGLGSHNDDWYRQHQEWERFL